MRKGWLANIQETWIKPNVVQLKKKDTKLINEKLNCTCYYINGQRMLEYEKK